MTLQLVVENCTAEAAPPTRFALIILLVLVVLAQIALALVSENMASRTGLALLLIAARGTGVLTRPTLLMNRREKGTLATCDAMFFMVYLETLPTLDTGRLIPTLITVKGTGPARLLPLIEEEPWQAHLLPFHFLPNSDQLRFENLRFLLSLGLCLFNFIGGFAYVLFVQKVVFIALKADRFAIFCAASDAV